MATNGQTPDERPQGSQVEQIGALLRDKVPEAFADHGEPQERSAPSRREREAVATREAEQDESLDAGQGDAQGLTAAELAEKRAAGEPEPEGDADASSTTDTDQGTALTVGDLAKKLGVDARALYNDLRIPLREGRGEITLSELKEGYQAHAILEDRETALSTATETHRTDTMQARSELETAARLMAAQVGGFENLGPIVEHARQLNEQQTEQGRKTMLAAFPEWKDPAVYAQAKDDMAEHLQPFGFSRGDLERTMDPRHVAYIHANMERDRRIAKARGKLDPAPPAKRQRAPSGRTPAVPKGARDAHRLTRQAKTTGTREDQLAAVSAVIHRGK